MTEFAHPCPAGVETDSFGWRPAIPGVVPAQLHTGQDWAAPFWTPVYAMHTGTLRYASWDPFPGLVGAGNAIQIGSAKYMSRYMHLADFKVVNIGQLIQAGQLIGWVGSTGNSTGPHLHAELHLPGGPVDPRPYLRSRYTMISPEQMKELKEHVTAHAKAQGDRAVKETRDQSQALANRIDFGTGRLLKAIAEIPNLIFSRKVRRHGVKGNPETDLETYLAKSETLERRSIKRGDDILVQLGAEKPAYAEPDQPR